MQKQRGQPAPALLLRVEKAFVDHGYAALSMIGLAKACDLTARALYNYFSNKEEAFRASVRYRNELGMETGLAAGRALWAQGGSALDILTAIIDVRYGNTRRIANLSPHLIELNSEVFRRCTDIVTEVSLSFEADFAKLIRGLENARLLKLRPNVNDEQLARALANGARGVNQRVPTCPPEELSSRYREICGFILYGCADLPVLAEGGHQNDNSEATGANNVEGGAGHA